MDHGPLATPRTEDELADIAVRRGRNAGGIWILAAIASFGLGLAAASPGGFALAWTVGAFLFAIGLLVRRRYWAAVRREHGDATIQRAQWRSSERDGDGPERIIAAVVLVMVLLAFQAWRR